MMGFIILGIMLLCGCSIKAIGVFSIVYGVIVSFIKLAVNNIKNQ